MSLIARCPACRTTFRVVQDQLRVSDGWVRCGRCAEIFDARLGLVDEADARQSGAPAANPVPMVVETQPEAKHQPALADADWLDYGAQGAPLAPPAGLTLPPEPVAPTVEPIVAPTSVRETATVVAALVEPAMDLVQLHGLPVNTEWRPLAQPGNGQRNPGPDTVPLQPDPSFLRPMPKPKPAMNVWVKVFMCLAVPVLMAVLALQAGLHERARLAAMFPQSKPVLQWACQYLGCTVSSLKQIESVVIDGSSFNKVRGENYRLALNIRNAGPQEIAMPALELSLTDSQDQVLMRKVILPHEITPYSGNLAGGTEWSGQIAIQVRGNAGGGSSEGAERFSGYRIIAFYP